MSNLKPAPLPVGDKPGWELRNAENDDEKLKSIPESFVLLKSLKQSRDRWLQQTFPKFSTKLKGGKATDAPPIPPHTFQVRGRCDMHIGPHIFPETTIYEVTYVSSHPATTVAPMPGTTTNPYLSSTMSYNAQYQQTVTTPQSTTAPVASTSTAPAPASAPAPAVTPSASASSSTTPAPAAAGVTTTTSTGTAQPTAHVGLDLIGKVNQAAANDPILSALLKTAAGGKATPEELKRLGLFIQSLDHITFPGPAVPAATGATPASQTPALTPGATPPAPPASAPPKVDYYQRYPPQVAVTPAVPVKPFDVVLEFRESPGDRWLFPRGSVFWDTIPPKTNDPRTNPDITLTTCLSNDGRISECLAEAPADANASDESRARYPVTITLKEAPLTLSDTIYRWIGGAELNAKNKEQIEKISFKRLYLGLQIPPGTLLTQLQAACNPAYALKPLRQGPAPPPRAPRPRKPPTEPKKVAKAPPEQRDPPAPPQPPPAKRPRLMPPKPVAPPPIRCSSCGQTDVPLIMGGKYCKPCVEAQRHLTSVAPTPLSMSSWATPQPFIFTAPVLARPTPAVESASASPPAPSNS